MSRKCTKEEGEMLLDGMCPHCREYLLMQGAEGGASMNAKCAKCEAVWNIGVGATMCELLAEPEGGMPESMVSRVLVGKDVSSSEGGACGLDMNNKILSEEHPTSNIQHPTSNGDGALPNTGPVSYPEAEEGLVEIGRRELAAAAKPLTMSAREGLNALVTWALDNRCSDTALRIRALLRSLYNGLHKCDLSEVQLFDTERRRQLCALIMGIGREVYDHEIRDTFAIAAGENGLRWFIKQKLSREEVAFYLAKVTTGRRVA